MMNIDLKLFVTLAKYLPDHNAPIEVPDGSTVGDLMERLAIPEDQVKLIFINNVKKSKQTVLKENDRVGLFPPVGGG